MVVGDVRNHEGMGARRVRSLNHSERPTTSRANVTGTSVILLSCDIRWSSSIHSPWSSTSFILVFRRVRKYSYGPCDLS